MAYLFAPALVAVRTGLRLSKRLREAKDCELGSQTCILAGMLTWDDLKHFLAFARTGSMLTAAKAQGANHSTVRRRLAELEKHLGCKLIERQSSGYRLTEVGVGLLPHAERVEEAVAACERYVASCDTGLTGVVRLTCSPTVGERLRRAPLFETFQARFPGLRIELVLSDRLVDL
jgi:DNA-binding transcriptional LysR family regulator